jgi:hypothetical protein
MTHFAGYRVDQALARCSATTPLLAAVFEKGQEQAGRALRGGVAHKSGSGQVEGPSDYEGGVEGRTAWYNRKGRPAGAALSPPALN